MRSLSVALIGSRGIPARYGGYELAPRALVDANRIVAHGSVAASWVQMVCGAHTFIVGRFPRACQDEVFAADPGCLIPGVAIAGVESVGKTFPAFFEMLSDLAR